jgi:succinate-semialdehyde dehydrogenase/glutarate-semialdehyde dehydrogenase
VNHVHPQGPALSGPPPIPLSDPQLWRSQCLIGGVWVGEPEVEVIDPATGERLGAVPRLGCSEAAAAVDAAERAGPAWRDRTAQERAQILRRWFDLVIAAEDDLAAILTAEQGKPLAEARGEIAYAASFLEWYAEEAKRLYGEVIPAPTREGRIIVLRQPVGVCAAITPWNFPAAMITRKAGPALAAGCTMVLKPASQTPFSALALAALAEQAGVPPGVFNVITGPAQEIGAVLTQHPAVRKISFTGSTEVGKRLMAGAASGVKRLSLELGGNAPFIVFDDADLDAAVDGAMASKFRNSGQTCVCVNRILVQSSIMDQFAERLTRAVLALVVGPGADPGITQGPLIDEAALKKVEAHVDDALARGARLMCGGGRHVRGGQFFEPTVLSGCKSEMVLFREETFGPVAALYPFQTEAESLPNGGRGDRASQR